MNNYIEEPLKIPYSLFTIDLNLASNEKVSSFLAATLRGGFGYSLKRLVCAFKGNECSACILKNSCVYHYLFETAPDATATRLTKYKTIPRPFALRPRQTGDKVAVDLLCIGKAVGMLPYFVYAFNELGKQGLGKHGIGFDIAQVTTEDGCTVYTAKNTNECMSVTPRILEIKESTPSPQHLELQFLTPLVLRKDGAIITTFDTRTFFSTLLRRITNINAFYGEHPSHSTDPSPYFDAVETLTITGDMYPVHQRRISTRQHQTIDYSGLMGKVTFTGDIETVLPYLKAGEVLGVGKNTVFGQGVYACTAVPGGLLG